MEKLETQLKKTETFIDLSPLFDSSNYIKAFKNYAPGFIIGGCSYFWSKIYSRESSSNL